MEFLPENSGYLLEMRIEPAGTSTSLGRVRRSRRSKESGFPEPTAGKTEATESVHVAANAITTPVAGEGLLLLQGGDTPFQKGVRDGRQMIATLESLHQSLLEKQDRPLDPARLKQMAQLYSGSSGDKELDKVLSLIRQRTAVEIAKLEVAKKTKAGKS